MMVPESICCQKQRSARSLQNRYSEEFPRILREKNARESFLSKFKAQTVTKKRTTYALWFLFFEVCEVFENIFLKLIPPGDCFSEVATHRPS